MYWLTNSNFEQIPLKTPMAEICNVKIISDIYVYIYIYNIYYINVTYINIYNI